jgi:hypothetical protein
LGSIKARVLKRAIFIIDIVPWKKSLEQAVRMLILGD